MPNYHVRCTREIYEYFMVEAENKEAAIRFAKANTVIPFDVDRAIELDHDYTVNADVSVHIYTND